MSSEQHHHYLPQSYQRGWAAGDGRVYVYQWQHDRVVCKLKSTKSTGARDGLYHVSMAPPEKQNFMEDKFWRKVDQWGADALARLRDGSPQSSIDKDRFITFAMSLEFRNPRKIDAFQTEVKKHVLGVLCAENYSEHRLPHEPETFDDFRQALERPGLSELTAELLCKLVKSPATRAQLLRMEWHVVSLSGAKPILTSDAPLIRHKGLVDVDGMLVLPLSSTEFFVGYNSGKLDMKSGIQNSIETGEFVDWINRTVIGQRIDYVYAADESQTDFIVANWTLARGLEPS